MPKQKNQEMPWPLVSIVIPMYNQQRHLDACIRSLCRQTYSNLQLIIVDDGSTDRSPQMADEWAARDARVSVIHKPNGRLAFARRDGYAKATGEFVMFVDSDDTLPRHAVETLVDLITTHEVDLVIGSVTRKMGFVKVKHYGDKLYSFPVGRVVKNPELKDKHYLGLFGNNTFSPMVWGRMFRKSAIDRASSSVELYCAEVSSPTEDMYFITMLFPFLDSMYRTRETVYVYRYGGLTTRYNSHFDDVHAYCDKRLQILDEKGLSQHCEPLLKQYADFVFEQVQQMIKFKHADKEEVTAFLKDELEHSEIGKRLADHFANRETSHTGARLMASHDYEGMYEYARARYATLQKSWKNRIKRQYLKLINRFS